MLNNVLKKYKDVKTLEGYVEYETIIKQSNIQPSKQVIQNKINDFCSKKTEIDIDETFFAAFIKDLTHEKRTEQLTQMHNKMMNHDLKCYPRTVNYSLDHLPYEPMANKNALGWYRVMKSELIRDNPELKDRPKTKGTYIRVLHIETKGPEIIEYENQKRKSRHAKNSFMKSIHLTAGNTYSIENKTHKKNPSVVKQNTFQSAKKPKSYLVSTPISIKNSNNTNSRNSKSNQYKKQCIYKEITRDLFNPTQSFNIEKPYVPTLRRSLMSDQKHRVNSPKDYVKEILRNIVIKSSDLANKKKTFIIRPNNTVQAFPVVKS